VEANGQASASVPEGRLRADRLGPLEPPWAAPLTSRSSECRRTASSLRLRGATQNVFQALTRIAGDEGCWRSGRAGPTVVRAMALNMGMLASYDQCVEFFRRQPGVEGDPHCFVGKGPPLPPSTPLPKAFSHTVVGKQAFSHTRPEVFFQKQ